MAVDGGGRGKQMSMTNIWCVYWLFATLVGGVAGAQVQSPASQLEAASALTSLDAIEERPWHLKLAVTVFNESKIPSEGTIEVWHSGTDERIISIFGDARSTQLKHDDKWFYSSGGPSLPFGAGQVLREVVHPGPRAEDMDGTVPERRKQKFANSEFDCVMLSRPVKGSRPVPLGLFPTYCIGNGVLRLMYTSVDQTVVLNHIGTFLGHDVAIETAIQEGPVQIAMGKVVTLATYTPVPNEFVPPDDMRHTGNTARVAGSVIAGNRISFVPPVYPDSAKRNHVEGTVLLHAIIERDGTIHLLRPMNACDPDLAIAAIQAVRQWKYKPYLLNGDPVEVDTTITVNFQLRG